MSGGGVTMLSVNPKALLADKRFIAAFRIAFAFLIASYAYLYGSDWLVSAVVPKPWLFTVNLAKGFVYMTVMALALFYFIHRALVATQAAEAQFQHIFDASPHGILLATADGKIAAANPALAEMLGRTQAELIGQGRDIMVDPEAPEVMQAIEARRRHGEARMRYRFTKKDGSEIPIYAAFRSFTLPNGDERICGIVQDLTESDRLDAIYREGERLRLVGHLAGGIAHDFNNLLTVISGNAEVLVDIEQPGSPQYRAAEIIATAGDQAAQLVQQLLAFARQQTLDPASFSIPERLTDLMPLLSKAAGAQMRIELVCKEEIWPAYADAAQFEDAVLNLVLNSKEALPDGGAIRIEAENMSIGADTRMSGMLVPGDYVKLSVTDNGAGMTAEVMARAIEPFFSTKEAGHGSGLGLSTAFGFAKQSGGHLELQSKPGEGSTVTIYLPRSVGMQLQPSVEAMSGAIKGRQERILIVEDDHLVRTFLQNALSQLGYRVIAVEDAAGALDILGTQGGVDLLVADVMLPRGLGGRELAAKLRETQPDLAVVFISGFPDSDAVMADDAHMRALRKPFHVQDLAQRIRHALDVPA